MRHKLAMTAIALALAVQPAFAADTTTTTTPAAGTAQSTDTAPAVTTTPQTAAGTLWYTLHNGEMRASKLIGTAVRNPAGDNIGKVTEVLFDASGKVDAVVVGVGGFLGIGERDVAINFGSLSMSQDSDGRNTIVIDATKESLKAAPAWKWPNA